MSGDGGNGTLFLLFDNDARLQFCNLFFGEKTEVVLRPFSYIHQLHYMFCFLFGTNRSLTSISNMSAIW